MSKKETADAAVIDKIAGNPLLSALMENDKKHLFQTNVITYFHKTGFHLFDYYFGSVMNIHDQNGKLIEQRPRVGQAAGTFNLFIGNTGSGKAEPVSTLIPTPKGPVRMGDIKPGMQVFNKKGKPVTVTAVFPHKNKEIARVTFSDGRSTLCDYDHLWEVHYNTGPFKRKSVKSTFEIQKNYKKKDRNGKWVYKYWIPKLDMPVQYPRTECNVDPYVMGVLIGIKGKIIDQYKEMYEYKTELRTNDFYISEDHHPYHYYDNMKIIADNLSRTLRCSHDMHFGNPFTYNFKNDNGNILVTDDGKGNTYILDNETFDSIFENQDGIPEVYVHNHPDVKFDFLRGYFDIKGGFCVNEQGYGISFEEDDTEVKEQIYEMVRSLGFEITQCNESYAEPIMVKGKLKYLINFASVGTKIWHTLHDALKSKIDEPDAPLYIVNIEYSHMEDAQCIMIDDPDHLYLTEDYIVTHNTTFASQIAGNIIRQYRYANVIHFDCEHRFDLSRCETITKLPSSFFNRNGGERYMIRTGRVGLDVIQEMVVRTYVKKMTLKEHLLINTGQKDEFGNEIWIFEPTIIIIDSITSVINETFNPESSREAADAEKMRGNTEGARDAKSMKGFFKDILPLCKEANIIIFGINHINQNMSMSAFTPVAKQQNYLKQDESIPGGKTMLYYPFNIVKLVAKPSDDFTEDADGFSGHIVMIEPVKSSSNQSGNSSKGVSFEMVFSHKYGFDSLRSMLNYGRTYGFIEGNRNRMKFRDDPSFTFSMKNLNAERKEKPIWESVNKFIVPELKVHLPFIDPTEIEFDEKAFAY